MKCRYCNVEIEENALFCSSCGKKVEYDVQSNQLNKVAKIIALVVVVLFIVVGVLFVLTITLTGEDESSTSANNIETSDEDEQATEAVSTEEVTTEAVLDDSTEIDGADLQVEEIPSVAEATVEDIYATSSLSEYDMTHEPSYIMDGNKKTAWVEGVNGQGEGESITIRFDGEYNVSGMIIYAGYQKSDDLYRKNSRPSVVTITYSNGESEQYSLEDVNKKQDIEFNNTVKTSAIMITIDSVYPGDKYEDTVISELSFY